MIMKVLYSISTLINLLAITVHYDRGDTNGMIMCGVFAIVTAIWSMGKDVCTIREQKEKE